jgi:hypothetical protein
MLRYNLSNIALLFNVSCRRHLSICHVVFSEYSSLFAKGFAVFSRNPTRREGESSALTGLKRLLLFPKYYVAVAGAKPPG